MGKERKQTHEKRTSKAEKPSFTNKRRKTQTQTKT